ncbi:unnamed protein product, partial [marine sediment metagenome]
MDLNKTIDDYELVKKIGEGTYGKVYKVKRKSDNKTIALKVINIPVGNDELIDISKKEVEYLKTLSFPECNPFIICYYDSYYDPISRDFLIEMEYIEGTDMFDFILESNNKNTKEIYYYFLLLIAKDIAKGLKYIHSKNIIHNDIKLENIMINPKYTPKIIDFGLACHTKYNKNVGKYCESDGGTPSYVSPEY